MRQYLRVQTVLFVGVLLSLGIMLLLFFTHDPASTASHLDSFAKSVQGGSNFTADAAKAAETAGVSLSPSFSLVATLLVAPIAWTSLMWSSYSVENAGEIKAANVVRNQFRIILGSLVAVTVMLLLLGWGLNHAVGERGMIIASSGYWYGVPEATINGTALMPNLMAISLTGSWFVGLLISLGFIFNSFQIVCNSMIGPVRILVAHGVDPSEAQRRARLEIGGPEQVKESCRDTRGTRWLDDLAQAIRVRQQGDAASAIGQAGGGGTTDQIRSLAAHMIAQENERFREYTAGAQRHGYQTRIVIHIGALFLFGLLWFSTQRINRLLGSRNQLISDLQRTREREARGSAALATTLRSIGDAVIVELGSAAQLATAVARLRVMPGLREISSDGTSLRARADHGSTAVPAVLASLDEAGVTVVSVTVSRPTLDDVYLRHAGRSYHATEENSR
jgi:hypothetical protein